MVHYHRVGVGEISMVAFHGVKAEGNSVGGFLWGWGYGEISMAVSNEWRGKVEGNSA